MKATKTIFDASQINRPQAFGKGLHRSAPIYTEVATLSDELAAEAMFRDSRAFDAISDRMSNEAEAMSPQESGLIL